MPPRHAYWTILIDEKPTAFRAREREELQPTFVQLQRKSPNVTMRWFARGKLWESREAERDDFQMQRHAAAAPPSPRGDRPPAAERRGSDWRPGGAHKDPRDRFKKKNRPERAWSEKDPATQRDRDKPGYAASKPRGEWRGKPVGPPQGDRPSRPGGSSSDQRADGGGWRHKPGGGRDGEQRRKPSDRRPQEGARSAKPPEGWGPPRARKPWNDRPEGPAPRNDRPWQTKPTGPRAQRKPWAGKPAGDAARRDPPGDARRKWSDRPSGGEGWRDKPADGKRPWSNKPPDRSASPRGDRPWNTKPPAGQGFSPPKPHGDRPWRDKPAGGPPRGDRPWSSKPPSAGHPPRGDRPLETRRRPPDRPASGGGWSGKPRDPNRKPFTPRGPRTGGSDAPPRKRRDDEE